MSLGKDNTDDTLGTVGVGVERLWVNSVEITESGVEWLLVIAFSQSLFITDIRSWQNLAFLLGGAAVLFTGFVALTTTDRKLNPPEGDDDEINDPKRAVLASLGLDRQLQRLQAQAISEASVKEVYQTTTMYTELLSLRNSAGGVQQAASDEERTSKAAPVLWDKAAVVAGIRNDADTDGDGRLPSKATQVTIVKWFVRASLDGVNTVRLLQIALLTKRVIALRLHMLRQHGVYRIAVVLVVLAHMCLAFLEAHVDAAKNESNVRTVLALEGILLGLVVLDLLLYWAVHRARSRNMPRVIRDRFYSFHRAIIGKARERLRVGGFRSFLVFCMSIDWGVRMATHYHTGPTGTYLFVPWTVLMRPLLLFSMSPTMRHATVNLATTMYQSKLVFGLGASFIIVATVTSSALLGNVLEEPDAVSGGIGRGFDDFRSSFLTMFIFIATGENYPDVVDAPSQISAFYAAYFVLFSFVGMFLLVSLLVAYFQKYYVDGYDRVQTKAEAFATLRRRTGLMMAFYLLKTTGDTSLAASFDEASVAQAMKRQQRAVRSKAIAERRRMRGGGAGRGAGRGGGGGGGGGATNSKASRMMAALTDAAVQRATVTHTRITRPLLESFCVTLDIRPPTAHAIETQSKLRCVCVCV